MSPKDSEYRSPVDAELIRYLDSELQGDDRTRLESSLAQDSALRERLDTLRRRGRKLRTMLEASDPPAQLALNAGIASAPPRNTRRPLLAAAMILLVLGTVVGVPPLRAWVILQWQRLSADRGAQQEQPTTPIAKPAEPAAFNLSFDVAHATFVVHVLNYQRSGSLLVRVDNVAKGLATIPQAQGEEVYVLPDGVRIVNVETSTADYELVIPRTVRKVSIRLPNAPFVEYSTLDPANQRRVIDLTRR
jgi:hypothetical protein